MLTGNEESRTGTGILNLSAEPVRAVRSPRSSDPELASYRLLALQLHYDLSRPGPRSALLISPGDAQHCARSSAELAKALAEELMRPVLLVDAATASAGVSRMLDCATSQGLSDLLAGNASAVKDLALPTTTENVFVLPTGGESVAQPSIEQMQSVLRAIEGQFDFVLFSGGSLREDSIGLAIASCAGCVLVVAVENETRMEEIASAQQTLAFSRPRKLGVVLTT